MLKKTAAAAARETGDHQSLYSSGHSFFHDGVTFYWRFLYTMNPAAKIFFYVFLAAEVLELLESLLFYFITWTRPITRVRNCCRAADVRCVYPDLQRAAEYFAEKPCLRGERALPHRTYILDDGNRGEVKELAEEFHCGYLIREERTHAKAGNLNNALKQTSGRIHRYS